MMLRATSRSLSASTALDDISRTEDFCGKLYWSFCAMLNSRLMESASSVLSKVCEDISIASSVIIAIVHDCNDVICNVRLHAYDLIETVEYEDELVTLHRN